MNREVQVRICERLGVQIPGATRPQITSCVDKRDECGAADKAENLARCKSSYCQLPGFGQLVDPVRAEATKHVLTGCQRLGRPAAVWAAVGTTWEASKFGGTG